MNEPVKIKLCGLSREADIETANELLPEYIGFVFAKKSKRYVSGERAATLKKRLDKRIAAVGVFVNEAPEVIASLYQSGVIDYAQLHGYEMEADVAALRKMAGCPIIQAFKVRTTDDLDRALRSGADHILLDGGAGNGDVFDWSLLTHIGDRRPFFLAGGLSADNVRDAIRRLRPYAVDVSSGIETDGVKDADKMRRFVKEVRG